MADINFSDSFFDVSKINDVDKKEPKRKHEVKKMGTLDFETDPFLYGRTPEPFKVGVYIGALEYYEFTGDDCLEQLHYFLSDYKEPLRLYAHNGGKFDFIFLLRMGLLERDVNVISGRIVVAKIGHHELRDSYAILPVPLKAMSNDSGEKLDIEYWKMEREHRAEHDAEISTYLKQDCEVLYNQVAAFIDRFGVKMTIGGTALKIMREMHPFDSRSPEDDEKIRKYYFGGRVECFASGIITGKHKVYDVNSMYPAVMADREHFTGAFYNEENPEREINLKTGFSKGNKNRPYFMTFTGINRGALPTRTKAGLDFNVKHGTFHASSHEIQVALKYNMIEIESISECFIPLETINFKEYVDLFVFEKIEGKRTKNKVQELFAKLMLNSPYGKTAQNPDNYYDWILVDDYDAKKYIDLDFEVYGDYDDFFLMRKPSDDATYYDVGIGASITGAARAVLLEAIANASNPLYCDTDSIICAELNNVEKDPLKLGAWDLEGEGDTLAIYGKKVYSLFKDGEGIKKACKGVNLNHDEILRLASGDSVTYTSPAPSFKIAGGTEFTTRILGAEKHSKLFDKFGEKKLAENITK